MKSILIILFSFFAHHIIAQQWEWVAQVNGAANDYTYDLFVDDSGFVYATGRNKEGVTFMDDTNPITPQNYGHTDAFISKYDGQGNLIWATLVGGSQPDWGRGIAVDEFGNLYVTGEFTGTAYFGPDTITAIGETDMFVSKLDQNGQLIWTETFGTTLSDRGHAISIDAESNVYVTGYIENQLVVGGNTLGTSNVQNGLVIKMDDQGSVLHAIDFQSTKINRGNGILCDQSGAVYVCGELLYDVNFGGTVVTGPSSLSQRDGFLAKLDTALNVDWINLIQGGQYNIAEEIGLSENFVYLTGSYTGQSVFNNDTIVYNGAGTNTTTINGARDIFVAKYFFDGTIEWVNGFGGLGYDHGFDVKVSNEDDIYVTGTFNDSVIFDNDTLVSEGGYESFTLKLNELGGVQWVKQHGGVNNASSYCIDIGKFQDVFVGGTYEISSNQFDTITLSTTGYDAYIAKLTQHPTPTYSLNYSTACDNDTVKVTTEAITSPLTYQFNLNQTNSWIDSNAYCFVYDGSDLTGEIIVSNNIYDDTLDISEVINMPSPIAIDLGADIETCDSSGVVLTANPDQNSYLWSTSETTSEITVMTSGLYSVQVVDSSGCTVNDTIQVNILDCSSIGESEAISIIYYHNNRIEMNSEKPLNIVLYSAEGKVIRRQNSAQLVEVRDLANGLYILQIEGMPEQFKFVTTAK